jgi:hypothetical protein
MCAQHLYAGVCAPGRYGQSNKISVKHTICRLKQIKIDWNFSSSDPCANVIIPPKRPSKLNIYYIFCTSLVKATTNSHEVSAFVRNALRLHFRNIWKLSSSFMQVETIAAAVSPFVHIFLQCLVHYDSF